MVTQARDLQRGMHGSASVLRAEHQIRHNAHVRQAEAREVAVRPIVIIMNENVASLVSYILEEEGLVTATAADIVAGAALADRNRACLTILDTDVLGRKQLIEQAIAPLLTTPSAPLLILTGAAEDLRRQLGRSPFIKIAQKPLSTPVLLGQIRGHKCLPFSRSAASYQDFLKWLSRSNLVQPRAQGPEFFRSHVVIHFCGKYAPGRFDFPGRGCAALTEFFKWKVCRVNPFPVVTV